MKEYYEVIITADFNGQEEVQFDAKLKASDICKLCSYAEKLMKEEVNSGFKKEGEEDEK